MKIEFAVPLPESETQSAKNLDGFLQEALAFMTERPVFTAQELHEHLLGRFSISDDPHEFWRCLGSIRNAVRAVCEANGTPAVWHQQEKHGYADRLFNLDIAGPPLGELYDSELAYLVRMELKALFHGREELTEDELLFYLQAHQGFTDSPEEIAQLLADDGFITRTDTGVYLLGAKAGLRDSTPPVPRIELAPVEVDGVMVVATMRTVNSPVAPSAPTATAPPAQHHTPPEVSPPTPDEAFTTEDLSHATLVLRRLYWQNRQQEGVSVSELVKVMEDGKLTARDRRFIVARLWRRGYLLRDTSNPQDSVVRLRQDLIKNRDIWPMTMARILKELGQPYEPPAQQKTGSQ